MLIENNTTSCTIKILRLKKFELSTIEQKIKKNKKNKTCISIYVVFVRLRSKECNYIYITFDRFD